MLADLWNVVRRAVRRAGRSWQRSGVCRRNGPTITHGVVWQDRQFAFPEPSVRWSHGSRSSGKICRVGTNRAASSIEPMCR